MNFFSDPVVLFPTFERREGKQVNGKEKFRKGFGNLGLKNNELK